MMSAKLLTAKLRQIAIFFALIFVALVCPKARTVFAKQNLMSHPIRISAAQSSWDWRRHQLSLSGAVFIKYGALSLRCEQATALFRVKPLKKSETARSTSVQQSSTLTPWQEEGLELISIKANGQVHLVHRSLSVEASEIVYLQKEQSIQAIGIINGRFKGHRVKGKDLYVNLKRGSATIQHLDMTLNGRNFGSSMKSLFGR